MRSAVDRAQNDVLLGLSESPRDRLYAAMLTSLVGEGARQVASAEQYGPSAVLTGSGYTDGRSESATGERQTVPFVPDTQLADDVGTPLSQPVTVTCQRPEWTC